MKTITNILKSVAFGLACAAGVIVGKYESFGWLFDQIQVPAWLLILLQWQGVALGLWWSWMRGQPSVIRQESNRKAL